MNELDSLITLAKQTPIDASSKKLAIRCLDYTSLNDTDTDDNIRILCQKASTPYGKVAALCIYPEFIKLASHELGGQNIKIATVANFPDGNKPLNSVLSDINTSLSEGADEIDLVFPYQDYLAGDKIKAINLVKAVKHICGNKQLKVILETGILKDPAIIAAASHDCLTAGADFLKTSTGKVPIGATWEAAVSMLQTIKAYQAIEQRTVGFKASGGIRTAKDAIEYITLAQQIISNDWVTPQTFRLGASSLLDDLLQ